MCANLLFISLGDLVVAHIKAQLHWLLVWQHKLLAKGNKEMEGNLNDFLMSKNWLPVVQSIKLFLIKMLTAGLQQY